MKELLGFTMFFTPKLFIGFPNCLTYIHSLFYNSVIKCCRYRQGNLNRGERVSFPQKRELEIVPGRPYTSCTFSHILPALSQLVFSVSILQREHFTKGATFQLLLY